VIHYKPVNLTMAAAARRDGKLVADLAARPELPDAEIRGRYKHFYYFLGCGEHYCALGEF
jgi:hypothetical protein